MTEAILEALPAEQAVTARVSVVIPVTSAETRIAPLVDAYERPLRESGHPFEFVFVLDGVGGRLDRELLELAERHPVRVVRLQGGGLGEAIALSAGVERSSGEFILNVPEYVQVEPDDLIKVLRALETGAEFVATWRHPRVDPWLNRLQSLTFNWMLRQIMGIPFHDLNSGMRGMRRHVLDEVNVHGELYRFLPVLAQRRGFKVVEVKVRHREEQGRRGFYGIGVYARRMLDIVAISFLTRFQQKPLRFFGMLGLLAMLVGAALCLGPLYQKLIEGDTAQRPVFVVGVVLIAFGVQLIGFGLIGEIIIFTQAKNLREYKVEEVIEGSSVASQPLPATEVEGPLRVRELAPGEDARFDNFVRRHPLGTFFHLTGWRKVVQDVFHHEPHYLVAEQGSRWLGVLPLFYVRSPFTGRSLISVPYAVYGGALADDEPTFTELMRAAESLGHQFAASRVELRHREERPGARPRSELYVTFAKDLPTDPEAVLPAIPKKARAEVRRARDKFGLTCEESNDLDAFYRLFVLNKRRLGSPSLPLAWFRGLVDEFGSQVVLHMVREPSGVAIAGVMSFCFGDTVYAYYSGSRSDRNHTGVNDFIYCRIMEWSAQKGFRRFDFGRSRRDTGPAAFKRNMGFEPTPLHYEYQLLHPDAAIPAFHPGNPRLRLPQRVWARLPVFLTAKLGGRLSKYLPCRGVDGHGGARSDTTNGRRRAHRPAREQRAADRADDVVARADRVLRELCRGLARRRDRGRLVADVRRS
jgi:FemAB-related protein (PEP-CTERM system-associated)